MTSQRLPLVLTALLSLSILACIGGEGEDSNNPSGSNNSDDPPLIDTNPDADTSDPLKDNENRSGKSFDVTPPHIRASGAFSLDIQDDDNLYTPVLKRMNIIAKCQTYGTSDMDGFTLDVYFTDDGVGLGLVQIVVRSKARDTWSFGPIVHPLDASDDTTRVNLRFTPEQEPEAHYVSIGGEATVTELPFVPVMGGIFNLFHLKLTSTVNLGVYGADDKFVRQATATWTLDVPFYESLEECFAN